MPILILVKTNNLDKNKIELIKKEYIKKYSKNNELKFPFYLKENKNKYLPIYLNYGKFVIWEDTFGKYYLDLQNLIEKCSGKENFIKLNNKIKETLEKIKKKELKKYNHKKYETFIQILNALLEISNLGIKYPFIELEHII